MKTFALRVIALFCMCASAFSQATVTVSGHIITGSGTASSANISILWELVNDNGQICKVAASGIIVPPSFSVTRAQLAAGIPLIPNNTISCGTTLGANRWRFTVKSGGVGTRQCSLNITGTTNLDSVSCLNSLPTTPIPATGDSLYARIDGTNAGFTGPITGTSFNFSGTGTLANLNVTGSCTGCSAGTGTTNTITKFTNGGTGAIGNSSITDNGTTVSIPRIFKRCYVDGVTYTTIASAYADSTKCLSVWLPPGYTETLSSDLVLSRSSVPIIFEGTATITMGTNRVTAAGTVNGISLIALGCGVTAGANLCVNFVYTGTGQAIVIGDSSTHSKDFYMHGISVQISGNGASCLQINNLDEFWVEHGKCAIQGGTNPIGVITNGTGTFVGVGAFQDFHIISGGGTNAIGYQFQNLTTHTQIIGGNLNLDSGVSAVCVDIQGALTESIELVMPNFNTCLTAVKVESSVTLVGGVVGSFRIDSGVTTPANFAAGTSSNQLTCVNCSNTHIVVDSGTRNSVVFPLNTQVNSKLWTTVQGSTDYEVINGLTAKSRYAARNGNSDNFIDAESAGAIWMNSQSAATGGTEFCHGDATHCVLFNPSPTANRTLTSPDGNSSTLIPFSFTTTAATTDNVTVTGMTASGHCVLEPTNSAAAAGTASVFVSAKAANQITVTHTATSGWTFDGFCSSN
jgi:hypothetical protein